jgi:hypothetical protein
VRIFHAVVGVQADQAQQLADPVLNVLLALDQVERADRLGHDGIDPEARIEARVGVLKDHLDAAAQKLARLSLPGVDHRYAVDHDFA